MASMPFTRLRPGTPRSTRVGALSYVLLGVGLLVGCGGTAEIRAESGEVIAAGSWSVFDLRAGDCIDAADAEGDIDSVALVPCAEPHTQEVFALVDSTESAYPGAAELALWADAACLAQLQSEFGLTLADGLFVSWDYVGPHRNQYSRAQWEAASAVNNELPEALRQTMAYPDLDLMIATDRSEAVHSELVLPMIDRYFDVEWLRRLGGGIAYPLLTHNEAIHDAADDEAEPWIDHVMQADQRFVESHPEHNLFAFVVARRRADLPPEQALIDWEYEERMREEEAAANGFEYGPRTELALEIASAPTPGPIGAFAARRLPGLTSAYNRMVEWVRRSARRR